MEIDLNKRYQTMCIVWFALLMSIVVYFLFLQFAAPQFAREPDVSRQPLLSIAISAAGTIFVLASFVVKRRLLERSVEKQDMALVQKAMIVACGMCEVSALLGFLERFILGSREYYLLFILAAGADFFHFPRRRHLEAASYKSRNIVT